MSDEIKTRRVNGKVLPAINVKVYGNIWAIPFPDEHQDTRFNKEWLEAHVDELNLTCEQACEEGFELAQANAKARFGPHVSCALDGRSNGWLVVSGLPEDLNEWDPVTNVRWGAFVAYCRDLVDGIPRRTLDAMYDGYFLPEIDVIDTDAKIAAMGPISERERNDRWVSARIEAPVKIDGKEWFVLYVERINPATGEKYMESTRYLPQHFEGPLLRELRGSLPDAHELKLRNG